MGENSGAPKPCLIQLDRICLKRDRQNTLTGGKHSPKVNPPSCTPPTLVCSEKKQIWKKKSIVQRIGLKPLAICVVCIAELCLFSVCHDCTGKQ